MNFESSSPIKHLLTPKSWERYRPFVVLFEQQRLNEEVCRNPGDDRNITISQPVR
jgi:hypothetical protein